MKTTSCRLEALHQVVTIQKPHKAWTKDQIYEIIELKDQPEMVLTTRLMYELAARPQDLMKIAYCDILAPQGGVSKVKWHSQKNNIERTGYISMRTV
jgi:integrase